MHPGVADIVKASAFVIAGCLGCAYALQAARRSRNWLYLICALGSVALVAGVVGQRVFPSDDLVREIGQTAAEGRTPGPWDAGIHIPLLDVHATPVALGGFLLAIAGLSLVLFFEPVPVEAGAPSRPPAPPARFEDEDAV